MNRRTNAKIIDPKGVNTVYLSGPMKKAPYGGKEWRSAIKIVWSDTFEWIDPTNNTDVEKIQIVADDLVYTKNPDATVFTDSEIVEGDEDDISRSDALFVGWDTDIPSPGTAMEMRIAFKEEDIPVCFWNKGEEDYVDLPAWVRYHSDFVSDNAAECVKWLENYGMDRKGRSSESKEVPE